MKCPNCGAWNRASLPVCVKCGTPLTGEESQPDWRATLNDGQRGTQYYRMDEDGESDAQPDSRDTLACEMAELKKRKADGEVMQQKLRAESVGRGAAPTGRRIQNNAISLNAQSAAIGQGAAFRAARKNSGSRTAVRYIGRQEELAQEDVPEEPLDDSRNYDMLWAEQAAYDERWRSWDMEQKPAMAIANPKRTSALRKLGSFLLAVLIIALVGAVGFFGYHYFAGRSAQDREDSEPTVIASILDDLAAHTVMIPGEDGTQIYIRELHNSFIVSGGFATIQIADHDWYDNLDSLTQESMEVTLTPFLKTSSGRQQPLDPITYSIDIPLSPISMRTPENSRTTVSSSMYTMEFDVRPGSKVTVNGKDVSDTVNAQTGNFSYNATVQPIGDNVYTVTCRSQYCRETSLTIVLYREPQEIPLDLAADTFTSTSQKHMTVHCTTLPGAVVDVLSPFSDLDITNLDTTGSFSFIAVFDHIGDNTIHITSSFPGKKTSSIEYTVYYIPPVGDYTKSAWPLNRAAEYSELVGNINYRAERTQVYVIVGEVAEMYSEKPQIALFYLGEDGASQPVVVRNYTKTTWQVGKYYRLYADVYGTYDGKPMLYCRYTYDN